MKNFTLVLAAFALVLVAIVMSARLGFFFHSDEDLKQRYANDGSQFITIDGVPLRYKDEGTGPAVILIHGAFGNLNMWDAWTEALKNDYRVIRIDNPPEGLSGPDPSGQHGHDRSGELVALLADELGLDRFAIGGTSRGAVVSYRYAAKYPERVTHLLLVNTPVLPQEAPKVSPYLRSLFWVNDLLGGYQPELYFRVWFEEMIFFDPSRVTDELVSEYASFNNREGKTERARIVSAGAKRDVEEISRLIGSIAAPTLIIASQTNSALALEDQRAMEAMFASTVPTFHLISDGGHFLPIEKGEETGAMAKDFLDSSFLAQKTAKATKDEDL